MKLRSCVHIQCARFQQIVGTERLLALCSSSSGLSSCQFRSLGFHIDLGMYFVFLFFLLSSHSHSFCISHLFW